MSQAPDPAVASRRVSWRPPLLIALVGSLLVAGIIFRFDARLLSLRQWISGLGWLGPFVYGLIFTAAVVAAVPGAALTIMAGTLFGSAVGIVLVSLAATGGAALAFLIARYFARDAVARWLEGRETFKRLDRMTEEHGALMVAVVRLIPLFPFNLVNYGFGLTKVPFLTYLFWSWLCMLPADALYILGADAVARGVVEKRVPWPLVGGFIATALILGALIRMARRRLGPAEKGDLGKIQP